VSLLRVGEEKVTDGNARYEYVWIDCFGESRRRTATVSEMGANGWRVVPGSFKKDEFDESPDTIWVLMERVMPDDEPQ
jgi:hypothetical protein